MYSSQLTIALVISITIHEGDFNALIEQPAENCEIVTDNKIARVLESNVHRVRETSEIEWDPECCLDRLSVQIACSVLGRKGTGHLRCQVKRISLRNLSFYALDACTGGA